MARPSATGALLLLLLLLVALSLLAVAHCRAFEIKADDPADESADAVVVSKDENGALNPTALPGEVVAVPTEEQAEKHGGFLRLPSQSQSHRHRPCRHGHGDLHRHLWWARHHGVFGAGEEEQRLAVFPAVETEAEQAKAVAEPDPDRSLPDSDEPLARTVTVPASFGDADGAREEEAAARSAHDDDGAVRAWKEEMLRRWIRFHSHHGMRGHGLPHHHHDEHAEDEAAAGGMKRFHHLHHRRHHEEEDQDEEEKDARRKRFRRAEAEHDDDSDDDEDKEVEEMVRRFRKAVVMARRRSRFGHGRRFHHHRHGHGYRHAEEGEKADGEEESGVMAWVKGLMNRF